MKNKRSDIITEESSAVAEGSPIIVKKSTITIGKPEVIIGNPSMVMKKPPKVIKESTITTGKPEIVPKESQISVKDSKTSTTPTKYFHLGHRQRLRERFVISRDSLPDYEIIEMLLFLVFSRRDTKTLAKILLNKFGSLGGVINADENQLKGVEGIGENTVVTLKLLQEIYLRMLRSELRTNNETDNEINNETNNENIISPKPKLNDPKIIREFCRTKIGSLPQEHVLILFLNNSGILVADEIMNTGSTDEVGISKGAIVSKAVINGSNAIVLSHNHPSGNPTPTREDKILTTNLKKFLQEASIRLLDHVIVSTEKTYSFARSGIL
jgi:DNA repair protein RadC